MNRGGLQLNVLGFPVTVSPMFLLGVYFLSGFGGSTLSYIALFGVALFFSILIHELGHAYALHRFGVSSYIVIHGFGGYYTPSRSVPPKQQLVVSLAGPLPPLLFVGLPTLAVLWYGPESLSQVAFILAFLNLLLSIANLAPVLPLDGGHVVESLIAIVTKRPDRRLAHIVSAVLAIPITVALYLWLGWGTPVLFGMFGVGYNIWQLMQSRKPGRSAVHDQQARPATTVANELQTPGLAPTRAATNPARLEEGWRMLEVGEPVVARELAYRVNVDDQADEAMLHSARTVAAWSHLLGFSPSTAAEALGHTPATPTLSAAMALAQDPNRGAAMLVEAIAAAPEARDAKVALAYADRFGVGVYVRNDLVKRGVQPPA